MKPFKFLIFFNFICFISTAQNDTCLINFIANNQFNDIQKTKSLGAIKQSKNFGEGGVYVINPYFSTISAMGLLTSNKEENFERVTNYIKWYSKHYNAKNGHYNVAYDANGDNESYCYVVGEDSVCSFIDAEDSEPAVFCTLLWQYVQKTNNIYLTRANKLKVEKAMQYVIDSLLDPTDNLCFDLKNSELPAKYTMDNCEVYQGFLCLSYLEKNIFKDNAKYKYYYEIAQKIKAAIKKEQYKDEIKLYQSSKGMDVDTTCWYQNCGENLGGCAAIIFPQIFNVDSCNTKISMRQRAIVQNNFITWVDADTSFNGGFLPAYIAFCFANAGDTLSASKQINNAIDLFYKTSNTATAATSQDAAWLLLAKESIVAQRKKKAVVIKKK